MSKSQTKPQLFKLLHNAGFVVENDPDGILVGLNRKIDLIEVQYLVDMPMVRVGKKVLVFV